MNNEHNGWVNRETWAANLWITNDEELYNHCLDLSEANLIEKYFSVLQSGVKTSSDSDEIEILMLLEIGSLWRVDWNQIAKSLNEAEGE